MPNLLAVTGYGAGRMVVVVRGATDESSARRDCNSGELREVQRCRDLLERVRLSPITSPSHLRCRRASLGRVGKVTNETRGVIRLEGEVGFDDSRPLSALEFHRPSEAEHSTSFTAVGVGDVVTERVDDPQVALLDRLAHL